jgi:glycosyltransferase involved in cell wall biosynthesis
LSILRSLKRLVKELSLDIIEYADVNAEGIGHRMIAPNYVPSVVRLQTPLFIAEQFYTQAESRSSYRLIGWAERKAIRRADALISPSVSMVRIINENCGIRENIAIIRNPLDSEYLGPLTSSTEFEFPENSVVYFGRLEKRKGALVFSDAIPSIQCAFPQTHFFFAGPDRHSPEGGSTLEEIRAQLSCSDADMTKVHFLGQVPRNKLRACYTNAPIAVIPSLYEDYPYAVIEAMACGTAVVASDCYGIPEIVRHGETGLLVKTGDSKDLAEKIIQLLKSTTLRRQLGEAAREFVLQECSQRTAAEATTQIYESIVEGKRLPLEAQTVPC